jgi:uncharacterized membrane protein
MNHKSRLLTLFLLVGVIALVVNCTKKEEDKIFSQLGELPGTYKGYVNNLVNNNSIKKELSWTITSKDNPVAGTYNLAGTAGNVSGSVLGAILNLTLKPTTTGVTYTFSGEVNNDDTAITGTMTGVESGTAVKYNVELKK